MPKNGIRLPFQALKLLYVQSTQNDVSHFSKCTHTFCLVEHAWSNDHFKKLLKAGWLGWPPSVCNVKKLSSARISKQFLEAGSLL